MYTLKLYNHQLISNRLSESIDTSSDRPSNPVMSEGRHSTGNTNIVLNDEHALGNDETNQHNKETKLRGEDYLTKLKQLLPSVFEEFEQGDLER